MHWNLLGAWFAEVFFFFNMLQIIVYPVFKAKRRATIDWHIRNGHRMKSPWKKRRMSALRVYQMAKIELKWFFPRNELRQFWFSTHLFHSALKSQLYLNFNLSEAESGLDTVEFIMYRENVNVSCNGVIDSKCSWRIFRKSQSQMEYINETVAHAKHLQNGNLIAFQARGMTIIFLFFN